MLAAASVDGNALSLTNSRRGFSRGTKTLPLGVVLPPGAALPGVPPPACPLAAERKSAGDLVMCEALMPWRGRMRTPERGVSERGVMRAAGRGVPPARRPAGRCVRPTLYSGAGDIYREGQEEGRRKGVTSRSSSNSSTKARAAARVRKGWKRGQHQSLCCTSATETAAAEYWQQRQRPAAQRCCDRSWANRQQEARSRQEAGNAC